MESAEERRERVARVVSELAAGVRQRQAETAALAGGGDALQPRLLDLRAREQLLEPPCVSPRPFFGPLVVWTRKAVYHLFMKWYLRGLLEQQQAYNQAASRLLQDLAEELTEARRELRRTRQRLLALESGGRAEAGGETNAEPAGTRPGGA